MVLFSTMGAARGVWVSLPGAKGPDSVEAALLVRLFRFQGRWEGESTWAVL